MLKQYGMFATGSVVGAAIDYVVTLGAVHFLGASPVVALGCAMIASATVTFLFHDRLTFPNASSHQLKRYALFMGWSALVFALRAVLLRLLGLLGLPLGLALLGAIGLASALNFAVSGAVIFAKARP